MLYNSSLTLSYGYLKFDNYILNNIKQIKMTISYDNEAKYHEYAPGKYSGLPADEQGNPTNDSLFMNKDTSEYKDEDDGVYITYKKQDSDPLNKTSKFCEKFGNKKIKLLCFSNQTHPKKEIIECHVVGRNLDGDIILEKI